MPNKLTLKQWLPVLGLTLAAFIFNTSEFIPIGLLSDIAADFGISETRAGTLISVYAWMVMLLSLPLMLMVSKVEQRRLMLSVIAIFTTFQILSFASGSFAMLMVSRIGVACSHAVFWSIVSPLAVRLVPPKHKPMALSMIITGTSMAMILGMPLGRMIGLAVGWRITFLSLGLFSFAVLAYLFFGLPKVECGEKFHLRELPQILKNPLLAGIFIFTFILVTGHYMGYAYIEPFMKQVARMPEGLITFTLMVFGIAGILGSLAFTKFYSRHPHVFITTAVSVVAASLLLLAPSAKLFPSSVPLCIMWGMAMTAFNVAIQSDIIKYSPGQGAAVAMSINSGIFNMGIACGTMLGGAVCVHSSMSDIGYTGGLIALIALGFWGKWLVARYRKAEKSSPTPAPAK